MDADWEVWLGAVVLLLIAAMSVYLLTGGGSWLVAGYNTASQEEKERYHEKRLCRVVGAGILGVTVLIFVLLFMPEPPSWYGWLIVLDLAVTLVLGNTVCKKKNKD